MIIKRQLNVILCILLLTFAYCAHASKIALTIDDLPYVGTTHNDPGKLRRENARFKKILATLTEENVPAVGFVVAGTIEPGQWVLLEEFHRAGHVIANHTHTHMNLNRTSADKFIANVERADQRLKPLLSNPKYFRYPYLARGRTKETRQQVADYLKSKGYVTVPVTIDAKDFYLNKAFLDIPWRQRKQYINSFRRRYLNSVLRQVRIAEDKSMKKYQRPIKQILLVHMNTLNAYFLGDLIRMLKKKGYEFITLDEALEDPIYHRR